MVPDRMGALGDLASVTSVKLIATMGVSKQNFGDWLRRLSEYEPVWTDARVEEQEKKILQNQTY